MKAILINPQDKSVTEVQYNGDYKWICALIEADLFDCVRIDNRETIYVDDEGLINGKANTVGLFYVIGDNPVVLAGKALVLGTDAEGETIETALTVEQIKDKIDFVMPVRINGDMLLIGDKSHYNLPN